MKVDEVFTFLKNLIIFEKSLKCKMMSFHVISQTTVELIRLNQNSSQLNFP